MIEKREIYLKLAEKLHYPPSEYLLRILEKMVTEEEGILLLELPGEPRDLAKKVNFDEEEVKKKLREFLERGVVVSTKKGPRLAREVTQLHDASLASSDKYIDQELLDLWKEFYEREWCQALAEQWKTLKHPMCAVIPAWESVQEISQVPSSDMLPEENMKEIIKGAECIAVVPCSCRRSLQRCDAPLDVCMQFNKWAEYAVDRGAGRMVSVEEALAINDSVEERGLVHVQPRVTPDLAVICNCCPDCCALLDPCLKYGGMDKALEKSRYRASIDQYFCTDCGDCVEKCPFGAVEMRDASTGDEPKPVIELEKCFGCGVCVVGCPSEALTMRLV